MSIDAADVADGNSSIVLGLIWNIILFFQVRARKDKTPLCSTMALYHWAERNGACVECLHNKVNGKSNKTTEIKPD